MLSASAFGSADNTDNTYIGLDSSGYHENLIQ